MNITIHNCNNIDGGSITLQENTLNIKYGINGTGKSTLAKAIYLAANDTNKKTNSINALAQFKSMGQKENQPKIDGIQSIKSIEIFNEEYINKFTFQEDELLKGSFNILIEDDQYKKGLEQIDSLIKNLKLHLAGDPEIDILIRDFNEIIDSFGRPTKEGLHASSNIAKAFKDGNKIENIPAGLEEYKTYIQHSENYKWLKWQMDGQGYIDISDQCPYCVSNINHKKETIKKISTSYESKSIESLNKIISTFQRLNSYFSDETKSKIDEFIKSIGGYTDDQVLFLRDIKDQMVRLKDKFIAAQNLSFASLKDVTKVLDGLDNYKIDLGLFLYLKSTATQQKAGIVNTAVAELQLKAGELQGCLAKHKDYIKELIEVHSTEMNLFLKSAGYKYEVAIIDSGDAQHKLKLIHDDLKSEVENVKAHLSYGERNAFAIILFMYHVRKSNPDLVILDDPISSFDNNKKYALIEMLFRKSNSLKNKTTLLLTHDFEPIIDMLYHHRNRFSLPFATFLENSKGILSEKEITLPDIKTFFEINEANWNAEIATLNKLVYLRRNYELTNERRNAYQLLSNLFHKRDIPTLTADGTDRKMTEEEINDGTGKIKALIPEFNYTSLIQLIKNDAELISLYKGTISTYEKLHIFRVLFDEKNKVIESNAILKFINETFHLDYDFVYQLNPREFTLVPQYVIDECDIAIKELEG